MALKGSVGNKKNGRRAENNPQDVLVVRTMLNLQLMCNPLLNNKGLAPLLVTPHVGDMTATIKAIEAFQLYVVGRNDFSVSVNGRIDPGDRTYKALVNGESLPTASRASTEDQIHNKLLGALEYEYWETVTRDPQEMKCLINKLLYNPEVDDKYLQARALEDYIRSAPPAAPPAAINFQVSVRGRIKESGLKKHSTEAFVKFLVGVVDEIQEGYNVFQVTTGKHTLSLSESPNGMYAASKNVEDWMMKRFDDKNSVYSCFPRITTENKAVYPTDAQWWSGIFSIK